MAGTENDQCCIDSDNAHYLHPENAVTIFHGLEMTDSEMLHLTPFFESLGKVKNMYGFTAIVNIFKNSSPRKFSTKTTIIFCIRKNKKKQ